MSGAVLGKRLKNMGYPPIFLLSFCGASSNVSVMTIFTKSFLITGGTTGLGFHTAKEIAKKNPNAIVVIASRKDTDDSAASINRDLNQDNVRYMSLDLGDLKNIRFFVVKWASEKFPPISALLLNAALQFPEGTKYTTDGFEATFGISHVGHALLFHLLHPFLENEARIIVTSSGVHDPEQSNVLETLLDACIVSCPN